MAAKTPSACRWVRGERSSRDRSSRDRSARSPGFKPQASQRPGVVDQPVQRHADLTWVVASVSQVGVDVVERCCEAIQGSGQFVEACPGHHDIIGGQLQCAGLPTGHVGLLAASLSAVRPPSARARRLIQRAAAPCTTLSWRRAGLTMVGAHHSPATATIG
jgi:hypothetical protein